MALNQCLGAAPFRCGRFFGLLADGHAMAQPDQPVEIVLGGTNRHAAHRNVLAAMLAAPGEGDAQRTRRGLGVLEEKLVEVSHAIEQQEAGVGGLDFQIL